MYTICLIFMYIVLTFFNLYHFEGGQYLIKVDVTSIWGSPLVFFAYKSPCCQFSVCLFACLCLVSYIANVTIVTGLFILAMPLRLYLTFM